MSNYIQIRMANLTTKQSDILIAHLNELGFHGFEEGENLLSAFIVEDDFNEDELRKILSLQHLSYSKSLIPQKNWNEEWEKSFEPVIIDDFVAVRADFHAPVKNVQHEIIITPKMSFGTGHHATTYLMVQQMREIDLNNKGVFDFGTGTGILAILSEKLGATHVTAIDNDEWSINNAKENIKKNNCKKIKLLFAGDPSLQNKVDVILANINKNVILEHFALLANGLTDGGYLLISGLLQEDETDILRAGRKLSLKHLKTARREKWIGMRFILH